MVLKISKCPYSAAYCKGTISVSSGSVLSLAPILSHMVWKTSLFPNQMAKCSWDLGVTSDNSFSFSSRINLKIEKTVRLLKVNKLFYHLKILIIPPRILSLMSTLFLSIKYLSSQQHQIQKENLKWTWNFKLSFIFILMYY